MKKYLLILLFFLLAFVSCATLQERTERKEQMKREVVEAVATKQMHIDITSMNTLRYGSRTVTPDFYLELKGDTVISYLPYLGQAYQTPMMSPSQGLNFEATAKSISVSQPKKDLSRMEITIKTDEDTYLYMIDLYDSGKAYIHVRSQHRDPISFDGDFVPQQATKNSNKKKE